MDYSPPSFSVHGIFQARVLEWVANCIYYYYVWPHCMACGILVPWPRTGPRLPQWKLQVLTYSRSSLIICFVYTAAYMFITTSWSICLPHLSPLVAVSLFSMSVSQFLLGFKAQFYWLIDFWLCWVLVAACVCLPLPCADFSLLWLLLLWSRGFRSCGSQVQWLWHMGSAALGYMGSSQIRDRTRVSRNNRANSLPLSHQGSPQFLFFK